LLELEFTFEEVFTPLKYRANSKNSKMPLNDIGGSKVWVFGPH
jgi:hypothetical protein